MGAARAFPSLVTGLARRTATVEWRLDRRRMLSYGLGLLAPILTAVIASGLEDLLGTTRLSFLFLASVLCVGGFLGTGPATAAALTAFATYNFYLVEPRYTLRLVPNGAAALHDAERRDGEAALRQFGLAPRKYVLGVGRLVPEKGFHDLLAAFRAANLPLKLVIAGGADHADLYSRRLLARGDADTIFTGVLTREQLWDLYRGASLFVLPSLHEGMPIAALEAIAAGAPALLSDIEANRDLGLPPAHYYPAGDVEALARRLKGPHAELAPDRESVLARFDWNNIAAQTGMVYAEVLGWG